MILQHRRFGRKVTVGWGVPVTVIKVRRLKSGEVQTEDPDKTRHHAIWLTNHKWRDRSSSSNSSYLILHVTAEVANLIYVCPCGERFKKYWAFDSNSRRHSSSRRTRGFRCCLFLQNSSQVKRDTNETRIPSLGTNTVQFVPFAKELLLWRRLRSQIAGSQPRSHR